MDFHGCSRGFGANVEVFVLGLVHLVIPRVPSDVVEHLQREREVEAFFIGQSGARQRRLKSLPIDSIWKDFKSEVVKNHILTLSYHTMQSISLSTSTFTSYI